jgi:hypothetical protein
VLFQMYYNCENERWCAAQGERKDGSWWVVKFLYRRNFLSLSQQLQMYENGIRPQSWLAIYGPKMDQTSSQNSGFPST